MPLLEEKTAFLRPGSTTTREEFKAQIIEALSGSSNDLSMKFAHFLDLQNLDKFLTIIFPPEAVEAFNLPPEMAEIDVGDLLSGVALSKIEDRLSELVTAAYAANAPDTQAINIAELPDEALDALVGQVAASLSYDGPNEATVRQWGRAGVEEALADELAALEILRQQLADLPTPTTPAPAQAQTPELGPSDAAFMDPEPTVSYADTFSEVTALATGEVRTLLPPNASETERALEIVMAERLVGIENPIYALWNVNTCPENLLPWLAWAFSVEVWDHSWDVSVKRAVIRNSLAIHRIKGTKRSIELALEALGMRVDLHEWFQLDDSGAQISERPHTFYIDILANDVWDAGFRVDAQLHALISEMLRTVKPVRTHFTLRVGEARKHSLSYAAGHRRSLKSSRAHMPTIAAKDKASALCMASGHRRASVSRGAHSPSIQAKSRVNVITMQTGHRARVVDRRTSTFALEEVA